MINSLANRTPVAVFSADEVDKSAVQAVDAALVKARTSNQELLETIRGLIRAE